MRIHSLFKLAVCKGVLGGHDFEKTGGESRSKAKEDALWLKFYQKGLRGGEKSQMCFSGFWSIFSEWKVLQALI